MAPKGAGWGGVAGFLGIYIYIGMYNTRWRVLLRLFVWEIFRGRPWVKYLWQKRLVLFSPLGKLEFQEGFSRAKLPELFRYFVDTLILVELKPTLSCLGDYFSRKHFIQDFKSILTLNIHFWLQTISGGFLFKENNNINHFSLFFSEKCLLFPKTLANSWKRW